MSRTDKEKAELERRFLTALDTHQVQVATMMVSLAKCAESRQAVVDIFRQAMNGEMESPAQ